MIYNKQNEIMKKQSELIKTETYFLVSRVSFTCAIIGESRETLSNHSERKKRRKLN